MPERKKLILQLNIPFCFKRCDYCGMAVCKYDDKVIRAYVGAMVREIEAAAGEMEDYEVAAVSLEGGSPVLAGPGGLQELLRAVRKGFRMAEDAEISLQTMPGDYSRALMEKMRDCGVNHWIFGVATAEAREHSLLGRPYRYDALSMVDVAVKTFDVRRLSFELLYGIPGQTMRSLEHSLEKVLYYAPEHVTLLPLRLMKGTELYRRCQLGRGAEEIVPEGWNKEEETPIKPECGAAGAGEKASEPESSIGGTGEKAFRPECGTDRMAGRASEPESKNLRACTLEEKAALYRCARERLEALGYRAYTIYDFAKPGGQSRYRLEQLEGTDQLGIGYGAVTVMEGVTYTGGHSLREYLEHSEELSVIANGLARLTPESEMRREITANLVLQKGIAPKRLIQKYGDAAEQFLRTEGKKLMEKGILTEKQKAWYLTDLGIVTFQDVL